MKKILGWQTKGTKQRDLFNELQVLKRLYHPNIVQLREVMQDKHSPNLYLVM
jgi:serine/threonine protein kinase